MSAADFGKLVIEEGHRGRQASEKSGRARSKESAGCYDLRKAGEVKKAVDALAVALSKAESKNILLELRKGGSGIRSFVIQMTAPTWTFTTFAGAWPDATAFPNKSARQPRMS